MSDTPRSDKLLKGGCIRAILVEHAKTLESELLAATREVSEMKKEMIWLTKQRDEWKDDATQSHGYIRSLAKSLGCEDGDTTPEMRIEALQSDLANANADRKGLRKFLENTMLPILECEAQRSAKLGGTNWIYVIESVRKAIRPVEATDGVRKEKPKAGDECGPCPSCGRGYHGIILSTASINLETGDIEDDPSSETFMWEGQRWTRHYPGSPMPCHAEDFVDTLLEDFTIGATERRAKRLVWTKENLGENIVGWRYAGKEGAR